MSQVQLRVKTKMNKENIQDGSAPQTSANPGYALGQLSRAFATSQEHPDLATQLRAAVKVNDWMKIFGGMLSGALKVGSRTPISDTPAWATLQVAQGGFATGDLLAGGPLQPHEEEMLARLVIGTTAMPRAILNAYYLSDAGIAELQQMVGTGCYRVNVPEEGALLMVAWLVLHDQGEAARNILDQIGPYLDRLRFYPLPDAAPLTISSLVHLQSVGQTIQNLRALKIPVRFAQQKESTQVWAPLCDRAVELFLETIEGSVPTLQTGSNGKPTRTETGRFIIEGGWPCQHYPESWQTRARVLLEDYRHLREKHQLCNKPVRQGENFPLLRRYLEACIAAPDSLTGREVGSIRSVLAQIVTRRGLPASERNQRLRQFQTSLANQPTNPDLAKIVIDRLAKVPLESGLETLHGLLTPVTAEEAKKYDMEPGQDMEKRFEGKIRRCLMAPVDVLIDQKIITSGEVLAKVVSQITAQVSAAGITDPDLQRLYGAVYQAFRRKRSLLLLNLESQVKLIELPWIKSISAQRTSSLATQEIARQTLEKIVTLAVTAFPHQILPNKLLQEIRTLADDAELSLPIVDEVAADIFMGAFSEKFLLAARTAGQLLQGTLYERYYGISYEQVLQIDDVSTARQGGAPTSPAFFQLCCEMAGMAKGNSLVAYNGTILEQEQILTTHNLAALFTALRLTDTLQLQLRGMAQNCFIWICQRHQQPASNWHASLHMVKNTAYAWRQMLFFLALESEASVQPFLAWASTHLEKQLPEFQIRFRPAMEGLSRSLDRLPSEMPIDSAEAVRARRFLGWTTGTHWLIDQTAAST